MKLIKVLSSFLMLLVLTACSDNGVGELKVWMDQVKKETQVRVKPVAEPKLFVPVAYEQGNLIDPFDASKLLVVFARMNAANDNGLKPNFDRPKEALEGYPLDTMKMVGTFDNRKAFQALIQVGKTVFPATLGAYLGQNFGKIVSITDTKIDIVETVQDATGEWTERKASLELQEAKR
nr:pilus assembly protein PilP [uncultured Undibacterium sp.]